jgi:hypothetical protein
MANMTDAASNALKIACAGNPSAFADLQAELNATQRNQVYPKDAITAFATGGQASATALLGQINRITTCATARDSVKLPTSVAGDNVIVINDGAAACAVFPVVGETIKPQAINTEFLLPAGTAVEFCCSVAGTWYMNGTPLPSAQFATGTTTTTFTAGQLTGAANTVYHNTGATPGSIATRTATQMFNDMPGALVGMSYILTLVNAQGTGVLTVTAGGGVTLTGTATIATNTWRQFLVTFTSQTALVMQNIATGTFS